MSIPLPSINLQHELVRDYKAKIDQANLNRNNADILESKIESYLMDELGITITEKVKQDNGYKFLQFVNFKDIQEWGILKSNYMNFTSKKYDLLKIKDLCDVGSGGTPSRLIQNYYTGSIPWVTTGELRENIIIDTNEKITEVALKNSSAKLYPKDSLLIAMYGATVGRTAKLGISATTNQACAVLSNYNSQVNINFLWEYITIQKPRLIELATGSAQPNLNADKIKNFLVPLPPLEIQNKIVHQIDILKSQIKDLKDQALELEQSAKIEFEQAIFGE